MYFLYSLLVSYNEDNIILEWTGTDSSSMANMTRRIDMPVEISDNIEMNQFRVVKKKTLKTLNERRGAGKDVVIYIGFFQNVD